MNDLNQMTCKGHFYNIYCVPCKHIYNSLHWNEQDS